MSDANHQIAINTIRFLAIDAVEKANSGHPGMPMGAAPMAYRLWTGGLKFDPKAPQWPDRDRFVLSAGHGSMLIYSLLHLAGYDLSLDELKNFRQWGSATPGHPEYGHTPGVETTTGPLGQGIGAMVGMAMAERHLAATYNRPGFEIVDHYTYSIAGDGCMMEGVAAEAVSLAGHLKLGKLVVLYDDNHITIDGSTDLAFTEDVGERFEAYGWQVLTVEDGNDVDAIGKAIAEAKAETEKPSLIKVRTQIGFGSPNKQGTSGVHGAPLGEDEVAATKANLGWPQDAHFLVPDEARAPFTAAAEAGAKAHSEWKALFDEYKKAHPKLAAEFERVFNRKLPDGWEKALPHFPVDAKGVASRSASGKVINALAPVLPELFGGSADLAPSNNTIIKESTDFEAADYAGRNIRFGVREHGMGAICNGIANHGGLRPFNATFFVFTDYMRPSIRLSALMGSPVIYVMTHDSVHLGEDGPTHQPVEHLASLRAMPGLSIIRPADANETVMAWKLAIERTDGPTMLVLSRQNLPTLPRVDGTNDAAKVAKGAYIIKAAKGNAPKAILLASGSEVHLALEAAEKLEDMNVPTRVVNMASWDLFDKQPASYREHVLPAAVGARVSVEAGATFGWDRFVGLGGRTIGIDRFGVSAPGKTAAEKLGITVDNVVKAALDLV